MTDNFSTVSTLAVGDIVTCGLNQDEPVKVMNVYRGFGDNGSFCMMLMTLDERKVIDYIAPGYRRVILKEKTND